MKRLMLLTCFVFMCTLSAMDAVWIDEEQQISISPFTTAIHKRYYFIARLKQAHQLIAAVPSSCHLPQECFEHLTQLQPTHIRLQECIAQLRETRSLEPLLTLWQEIKNYKYLDNEQFMGEYTALLCVMAQCVVSTMRDILPAPAQKALLALVMRSMSANNVTSPDVIYRYYIVKRLARAQELFKKYQALTCNQSALAYFAQCSHDTICQCVEQVQATHSLRPIADLLSRVHQYHNIHDITFIAELLQVVLIAQQHIIAPHIIGHRRELFVHEEYNNMSDCTIEELLNAIDIVTARIEQCGTKQYKPLATPSITSYVLGAVCAAVLWYITG